MDPVRNPYSPGAGRKPAALVGRDDALRAWATDRATPAEQQYLRAMAVDGDDGSSSGEIASRLNKEPKSLGPTRAALINKGLVFAPEHGIVAFTVPGMAAFVARQIIA